jgi:DNA-binding response OmpR family regulator
VFGKKERRLNRLLVVEDEPLVAFATERFLGDEGFEIVGTVDRVTDAVALLSDGLAIDLVLVDMNLADGSGIEVARRARERGVSVMFVTGACPAEATELADGCLAKPYAPRHLLAAITAIERAQDGRVPRRLPAGFRLFVGGGAPD